MAEPTEEFIKAWKTAIEKDGGWSDAAWEIWQVARDISNNQPSQYVCCGCGAQMLSHNSSCKCFMPTQNTVIIHKTYK